MKTKKSSEGGEFTMDTNKRVILLCGGSDDAYKSELAKALEGQIKKMELNALIVDEGELRQQIKEDCGDIVIIAMVNPLADLMEQIIVEIEGYGFITELVYLDAPQGTLEFGYYPDVALNLQMTLQESVDKIISTLFFEEKIISEARDIAMQAFSDPNFRCASGVVVGARSLFPLIPKSMVAEVFHLRGGMGEGSMCGAFNVGSILIGKYSRPKGRDKNIALYKAWFGEEFSLGDGLSFPFTEGVNCDQLKTAWKEQHGDTISTEEMCKRVTGAVTVYFGQTMLEQARQPMNLDEEYGQLLVDDKKEGDGEEEVKQRVYQ